MMVKHHSLRKDFETSSMKEGESVETFVVRAVEVVNKIHPDGDKIDSETVITKVLRSLTPKYDHVVAAIEESKDLSTLTMDECMTFCWFMKPGSPETH